jgi:hypothetical protein
MRPSRRDSGRRSRSRRRSRPDRRRAATRTRRPPPARTRSAGRGGSFAPRSANPPPRSSSRGRRRRRARPARGSRHRSRRRRCAPVRQPKRREERVVGVQQHRSTRLQASASAIFSARTPWRCRARSDGCRRCCVTTRTSGSRPRLKRAAFPGRWMPHSRTSAWLARLRERRT